MKHTSFSLSVAMLLVVACSTSRAPDPATGEAITALTADQCNYFDVNGKVRICHKAGSTTHPFTVLNISDNACINAHADHPGDYVAVGDPTCHGGGCLPVGAPTDPTLPCCEGLVDQGGVCTDLCAGVTCGALDGCHVAGTCDPATGTCSNPNAADGTSCDDGSACTQNDVCSAGTCAGTSTCNPNNCEGGEVCNGDGTCSLPTPTVGAPRNLTLSFGAPTFYPSDAAPQYPVIADFDRDCKADIAVSNLVNNNLSVFLGDGSGAFGTATTVPTGINPVGLVVSDFNRDGLLDLAVASNADSTLLILLGDGAGGFTAHATLPLPAGSRPSPLVSADFNGDGFADLATGDSSTASVSVLLGDGIGGFGAAVNVAVGILPIAMAVGDFNGDGHPDLAVANLIDNDVSVLLGDGTGGFGAATSFAVGRSPEGVLVADLNEDGNLDLVVADNGSNDLFVLLGDGAGSFAGASLAEGSTAASGPSFVAGGDFDLDGHVDLFVVNNREGTVGVLPGTGTGSFPGPFSYTAVGRIPGRAVVGDLNGDGLPDAVFTSGNSNGIGVMLNTSH